MRNVPAFVAAQVAALYSTPGWGAGVDWLARTVTISQHVYFSGVGKSGHIAELAASQFRSVGKPSSFLDPIRALHGEMGSVQLHDAVIFVSHSGGSQELLDLCDRLTGRRHSCPWLGVVTAQASSPLAQRCLQRVAPYGDVEESVSKFVPSVSLSMALVTLQAILAEYVDRTGTPASDLVRECHPGGEIGRQLQEVTA